DTIVDPRRHRRITKAEADGALSTLRHGGLDLYARTSRGILGNLDVQGSVLACDRHRGGGSGWLELARILRLEVGRDLVLARDGEGQLSGGYAINHWSAGLQGTGGELYGALGCGLEASAQGCGLIGDRSAGRLEAQGHLGGVLNGDARQLGGPGIQRCASASAGRALHRGPDGGGANKRNGSRHLAQHREEVLVPCEGARLPLGAHAQRLLPGGLRLEAQRDLREAQVNLGAIQR